MSLDAIIDKKKIFKESKVIAKGEFVGLSSIFSK